MDKKRHKFKILVTGAAGFMGSEFVRFLVKRGYNPIIADNLTYAGDMQRLKQIQHKHTFYKINVCNKKGLEYIFGKERPNTVVHFAAETHVDRSIICADNFINTNVRGTQILLDCARRFDINRFIHISTDEVYGEIKSGSFSEDSPITANSPYAASKAAADMLARAYFRTYKVPVVVVRPCNNYGPWQYPEKLIPVVIMSALRKKRIPVYGRGLNVREWLLVSDCAEAIFTVMKAGKIGEVYNIGSGQRMKNLELVKLICNILDRLSPLAKSKGGRASYKSFISFVKDRPGHDLRYSLDSTKIYKKLNWRAKTNFKQGLEKTISWFILHRNWWLRKIK